MPVELTVDGPLDGEFQWTVTVPGQWPRADLGRAIGAALDACRSGDIQLWIREVEEGADKTADSLGFVPYRDLWQLRCPLPNLESGIATRPFTELDIEDFIRVNNRAFQWHPEQGSLTTEAVRASMAESWFDPDGFRLLHDDGRLAGFCWTKIHPDDEPPLGEIYVIAIDPDWHGRGLGKPMTLAGLEWLAARGLDDGMLYVESDNDPANATYTAIGFTRHHTDRAYRLDR